VRDAADVPRRDPPYCHTEKFVSPPGSSRDDLLVPSLSTFVLFAAASLALLVVPGPAVLYIVTRSAEQGRRAGLASVAGVHLGTVVHVVAAAVGLSALLVSSAAAFALVKYAGAAYLVALGVRRLLGRGGAERAGGVAAPRLPSPARAFRQGVVVNVLNPKTALFFLAFLPPFLAPARGPLFAQVLVLGATFIALGLVTDGTYALLASYAATRWRRKARVARLGERASGIVYVGLGLLAALTPRHASARS
jgi:threonine/homoserine/homoserine lactone efflux protein